MALRRESPTVRIIALTGGTDDGDFLEVAMLLGFCLCHTRLLVGTPFKTSSFCAPLKVSRKRESLFDRSGRCSCPCSDSLGRGRRCRA
jgi:hypothetical protein